MIQTDDEALTGQIVRFIVIIDEDSVDTEVISQELQVSVSFTS